MKYCIWCKSSRDLNQITSRASIFQIMHHFFGRFSSSILLHLKIFIASCFRINRTTHTADLMNAVATGENTRIVLQEILQPMRTLLSSITGNIFRLGWRNLEQLWFVRPPGGSLVNPILFDVRLETSEHQWPEWNEVNLALLLMLKYSFVSLHFKQQVNNTWDFTIMI